jgi:hypothetical protein
MQEYSIRHAERSITLIRTVKKTIYTLNVNKYAPEITALTYPLLKHYANKCGADFHVISKRKYLDWPVTYEKLQIYDLAHKRNDDWSIFLDSDTLVHPETLDWTNYITPDVVMHNGTDYAAIRWKYDKYFLRDGRNIGSCDWNTTASSWCQDLWKPLDDMTPEEAIKSIFPTNSEVTTVITAEHLIDDYALSRNIAKFGLKTTTIQELQKKLGFTEANFYFHIYTDTTQDKVEKLSGVIKDWKLERFYGK